MRWAQRWPERRWAIEGARGLGQLLAQQLVAAGEHVTDVPATLAARVRALDTGHGRKTDRADARSVALVAARRPDLPSVAADDHHRVLRLLADRCDELTRERRRTVNRLHRHLRDLIPGGAPTHLSANTAAGLLAKARPRDSVEAERKQMARELLADVRRLDKATAHNRRRCAHAVAASGTTLTRLTGISDVLAAKILGHIDDINRFPSADHLASYAGTAPIEDSSGDIVRHRLSRHGNRQLVGAPPATRSRSRAWSWLTERTRWDARLARRSSNNANTTVSSSAATGAASPCSAATLAAADASITSFLRRPPRDSSRTRAVATVEASSTVSPRATSHCAI